MSLANVFDDYRCQRKGGGVLFGQLHYDMVVKNCMLMIDCFLSKLYLQGEVSRNGAFPTCGSGGGATPQTMGQI